MTSKRRNHETDDTGNLSACTGVEWADPDRQLRVVDMGKYNLGVGIIHRGPTNDKPGDPISVIYHDFTPEVYIITSCGDGDGEASFPRSAEGIAAWAAREVAGAQWVRLRTRVVQAIRAMWWRQDGPSRP